MYYKGDQMVKKLYYGTQEIKAVYIGEKKIYPNITGQQTGSDTTPWTYDLPKRTRTVTPWTQDVYADGSLGDKVYGPEEPQTETATVSESKGTWSYTTTTSSSTRTRVVNNVYTFTDEVKTAFKNNETETGERSVGTYTYNWTESKRTATVTYKYTDDTQTILLSETGTVTYNFTITPNSISIIPAEGGYRTINSSTTIDKKWNNIAITTATITVNSLNFSITPPIGFTIAGRTVYAAHRRTQEGNSITANIYGIAEVDNKIITSSPLSITQQANLVTKQERSSTINDQPLNSTITYPVEGRPIFLKTEVFTKKQYTSGSIDTIKENISDFTITAYTNEPSWISVVSIFYNGIQIAVQPNPSTIERFGRIPITITHKTAGYSIAGNYNILQQGKPF